MTAGDYQKDRHRRPRVVPVSPILPPPDLDGPLRLTPRRSLSAPTRYCAHIAGCRNMACAKFSIYSVHLFRLSATYGSKSRNGSQRCHSWLLQRSQRQTSDWCSIVLPGRVSIALPLVRSFARSFARLFAFPVPTLTVTRKQPDKTQLK